MLTPGADPVRKISIIPRGQALGVTLSTPETDRYNYRREELLAQIKVALGGRAAEKVIFDDLTHRRRVRHPEPHPGRPRHGRPLGHERRDRPDRRHRRPPGRRRSCPARHPPPSRPRSWSTRRSAGSSTRPSATWSTLLERERDRLEALATALLERETLDQPEAYEVAGVPLPDGRRR